VNVFVPNLVWGVPLQTMDSAKFCFNRIRGFSSVGG